MNSISNWNRNFTTVNGIVVGQPRGLSNNAWDMVKESGLLEEEDGVVDDYGDYVDFLIQFAPADLQIVLDHWGRKFETLSFKSYGDTLPAPLDFSHCINASYIDLSNVDSVPRLTGLEKCGPLSIIFLNDVQHIAPYALDSLDGEYDVTIYCENSGLFRERGLYTEDIDTAELMRFLTAHPRAMINGLVPTGEEPDQNLQQLINSNLVGVGPYNCIALPALITEEFGGSNQE